MTFFIIIASLFFTISQLEKLIKTQTVQLGYIEQLATADEVALNYTLSDAENMTLSVELMPKGDWVNKDETSNETIKHNIMEFVKFVDVTATVYNKNMSRGTSPKSIGWPVL